MSQRLTHNAIQRLLLKRFALAAATYGLALLLLWLSFFTGHYEQSLTSVAIGSALVVISQSVLFALFWSGRNLRFADPSLTEAQVLIGLGWQTWLIAHLDEARGAFLVFYVLILLFGLFHLSRRAFIRCALLVFFSFCAITLWDGYHFRLREPALAALQVCILAMVLAWLVLYARFVQVSRQRHAPAPVCLAGASGHPARDDASARRPGRHRRTDRAVQSSAFPAPGLARTAMPWTTMSCMAWR